MTISERTTYERLENGVDLYLLPTKTHDVVVCNIALPGGSNAIYEKQTVAMLVSEILPGSTKKQTRSTIRDQFDALGAQVSIQEGAERLFVRIRSRSAVFSDVFTLLVEVLTAPKFSASEVTEGKHRLHSTLQQLKEDTNTQAGIARSQLLYKNGHPHWIQTPEEASKELETITPQEVQTYYRNTLSSVGGLVVIAGDISVKKIQTLLRTTLSQLPNKRPSAVPHVHLECTNTPTTRDVIVSLHDKINVDTLLAIPLSITRTHEDYHALAAGVHVLGGGASSRLFHTLRTKKSLTYGAYGSLGGLSDGYPGFLSAHAIFPHDVFMRARPELRAVVETWAHAGISATELKKMKEEVTGKYKVGLSTTNGLAQALFTTILNGRDIAFIDTYPELLQTLHLHAVNKAIHDHIDYSLSVTAAAGAVTQAGEPLV